MANPCPTPYPERFHAATRVGNSSAARSFFSDETRLMLFALERRATRGALTTVRERTGASDAEALAEDAHLAEGDPRALRAMARAWEALDATPASEAMRLYVKVLDEEKPNWWDGAATEARRSNRGMHAKGGMEALPEAMRVERGRWEFLEYAGTKPTARFQHAATVAGAKMYVIGGSFRGRFMNDTHELDLTTSTWRRLKTKPGTSALPACAGHRAVTCRGVVFVVGGRFKGPETSAMSVYRMETKDDGLDEVEWVKIETGGDEAPCARRGASVTMVGEHKCIVFGGEDDERRFLNDAWILDMTSFVWRAVKAPGGHPPESRAEHTATMWGQDTLLVFGGTGRSTKCFSSLFALDLVQHKWIEVNPRGAARVEPRAGHAAVLIKDGRFWVLVGGGNNERGLSECSILDLEEMEWVDRNDAFLAPPIVGEGMTLCALSTRDGMEDAVVAFGGYNGACQNETQILRVPEDFPEHEALASDENRAPPVSTSVLRDDKSIERDDERDDEHASSPASALIDFASPDKPAATTFAFGTDASVQAYRKENVELRRALHRMRNDAQIVADAHAALRVRCEDLERGLSDERRRNEDLERKVAALAEQIRGGLGASGSFFSP